MLDKAFTLAESGRPGPVLVDVPMDVFSAEIDVALFDKVLSNTRSLAKPSLDEEVAERIVRNLLDADKPVLYVGGGIVAADAASELEEFAELLSLPVAHSLMGKGALPDDSPLVLGMTGFWGTAFVNETTRTADWILALGTRFAEADSSSWYAEYTFDIPATKLMQIDIDPAELGRNYPLEIGALADLKSALTVLIRVARRLAPSGVQRDELLAQIAANRATLKLQNSDAQVSDAWPMRPERILSETREVLPRRCDHHHRRGLEQERRGSAVRHPHPGHVPHPGRLRDHGLRRAGGRRREDRPPGSSRRLARRRRRLRAEPGGARHRSRRERRRSSGSS